MTNPRRLCGTQDEGQRSPGAPAANKTRGYSIKIQKNDKKRLEKGIQIHTLMVPFLSKLSAKYLIFDTQNSSYGS